jgi:hypothetical protein
MFYSLGNNNQIDQGDGFRKGGCELRSLNSETFRFTVPPADALLNLYDNKISGTLSQIFCLNLDISRGFLHISLLSPVGKAKQRLVLRVNGLLFYSTVVYSSIYLIIVQVAGKHGDERGGAYDAPRQEGCKNQGARGMADSLQSYTVKKGCSDIPVPAGMPLTYSL